MSIENVALAPLKQLEGWQYYGALAAGATYTPDSDNIITMAALIQAAQDLDIVLNYVGCSLKIGTESLGLNECGYMGALYCDGMYLGLKNQNVASKDLFLTGLTLTY